MKPTLDTLEKIPRLDTDTPWKNILDVYFRDFMEYCLPTVATEIEWLMVLPESLMLEYHHEVKQIEEQQVARFVTTAERVGMMKGHQKGLQQGISEMIIRILCRRFPTASAAIIAKIQEADIDTLLNWEEKIAVANTIEDIFH